MGGMRDQNFDVQAERLYKDGDVELEMFNNLHWCIVTLPNRPLAMAISDDPLLLRNTMQNV